jgi:hypothetical protein
VIDQGEILEMRVGVADQGVDGLPDEELANVFYLSH